jgi:hypothetical protein
VEVLSNFRIRAIATYPAMQQEAPLERSARRIGDRNAEKQQNAGGWTGKDRMSRDRMCSDKLDKNLHDMNGQG